MIAYLEKYDTTVDIPDTSSDKDVQDINENFHRYVDQPQAPASTLPTSGQPPTATPVQPAQKWQPNLYESILKAALTEAAFPTKDIASFAASPAGQAFGGKALEQGTFGLAKPLTEYPQLQEVYKEHPAFADAGAITGGVGSLMVTGGALKALGAGEFAVGEGKAAVEAGWAAGERYLPKAIMGAATFGTQSFIKETVKAFQDGNVNLEQFGKDVLTSTAFGGVLGMIGGIGIPNKALNIAASVSSAGGLGFVASKMAGSDNREATLNGAIWAAFEAVGSAGKSEALRMEALRNVKESIGEYAEARNPGMGSETAQKVASTFVDHAITKAGFENAEDIAKSGPENLLEGLEKLNQIVRTAHVPTTPEEGTPALPKLPAPVAPESPVTTPEPAKPQTPLEKTVETIKGILGVKTPEKPAEQALPVKAEPANMEKGLGEIAERFQVLGMKPNEGAAIFNAYGLDRKDEQGQPTPLTDLVNRPIEEQYQEAYKSLVAERGLEPDAKPNAQIMDHAEKAVDLINGYFNLHSQEVKEFAAQYPEASDHDIAQMAHNRGLLEEPNNDLLKMEIEKAKQEKIIRPGAEISKVGGEEVGLQVPPGQLPTGPALQGQEGKTPVSAKLDDSVFPRPVDPSLIGITGHPEFVKVTREATEIVRRYAKERGIEPTAELGKSLFKELHDAFNEVRHAKPADRVALAKQAMKKYPTLENDFVSLKDKLYMDVGNGGGAFYFKSHLKTSGLEPMAEGLSVVKPSEEALNAKGKPFALFIGNQEGVGAMYNVYGEHPTLSTGRYMHSTVNGATLKKEGIPVTGRDARVPEGVQPSQPIVHAQMASGATFPTPAIPIPPDIPKAEVAGTVEPKGLIRTYYEEVRNFLMPSMADPEGARILSASFSHAARQNDIAEFTMRAAKKFWGKQSHDDVMEFYDNLENGRPQPEKWQAVGQMLREAYDKDRADVQALGEGKLEEFNKNFAAHYWEKEGKTAKISQGRRPFEGSKGFLKQRTYDTLKEGIEAGKVPLTWNPVELFEMKHAEMQKFVASHKALKDAKRTGRTKFVRLGSDVPENAIGERYVKINDPVGTVYKSPMIEIKEAYDKQMMDNLNTVAKSLGINLERKASIRHQGVPAQVWGYSQSTEEGKPGKITSKFAGPESVIAHELGHQLDNIYGLQDKFLSDPKISHELSDLANQRITEVAKGREAAKGEYQGEGLAQSPKAFREYVQKPEEKMAAMLEAYIHAPELLKEIAPNTYTKLTGFLKSEPKLASLTEIKPSLLLGENKGEVFAGGPVLVGNVYAEPNFARLFNNHLSKGLEQSALFRGYRFLSNLVNQIQLFGGFHANFMSGESMATELDIAMRNLFEGNLRGVAKGIARTPIGSIDLYRRGTGIMNAWRGQEASPLDKRIADILEMSGGRIRMDDVYSTNAVEQMKDFFSKGRNIRGLLSIPFAAIDEATMPILKMLVPHTKVGAFGRMMEMELENNPNMTNQEAAVRGQKIWNTIEYRMGQMTYDNIFWNRTFKDALHFGIRSVAWNFGTAALALFGVMGVKDLLKGKRMSEGYYALSYWIASAMITATANSMYQYLMTGKGPQEPLDYLYPKNGGVKEDGKPSRSIPLQSYWPTVYNFGHNPKQTMVDKMNAVLQYFGQSLQNKDFFGEKIRDVRDEGVKGLLEALEGEAKHLERTLQPFGLRNMIHNMDEKNASLENVVGPWFGDVHAPYWVDQTKAEALAHEINADKSSVGGRTEEQIERKKLLNQLMQSYKTDPAQGYENIKKAYYQGAISKAQVDNVLREASMTPLQRMVRGMSVDEAERVYARANDDEKAQLELMLEEKRARHEREFVAQ